MPDITDPRWAWQRYEPNADAPWNLKRAGHLLRRATFGFTIGELENALRDGPHRTIDHLLAPAREPDSIDLSLPLRNIRETNNGDQLSSWWLMRMLYSNEPLRERITLFWHNHFATSNRKVNNASYMLLQYDLMRRHALGNFRTLLEEMSHDPAMMVWLDTVQSRRDRPNENYARELMELFSLGINNYRRPEARNYTEQDIREAARAFTGLVIENNRGVFRANQHDDSEKTVMGQRGRWQPNDIVRICLEQESAAYFIVGKLFKFLVSETVPATADLIEPLATEFRRDYNFGALVERMLRSNLFFSERVYRTRIKWPVDFALGIVRGLEGHVAERPGGARFGTVALSAALEGLGQRVFYPPSVAGWDAGRAWLNGQTLLFRHNLALGMTSTNDNRFGRRADPARVVRKHNRRTDGEVVDFFLRLFVQDDVSGETRGRLAEYVRQASGGVVPSYWSPEDAVDQRVRALCHLVLCVPEFQLD